MQAYWVIPWKNVLESGIKGNMILMDKQLYPCPNCGEVEFLERFYWSGCSIDYFSIYCNNNKCDQVVENGPTPISSRNYEHGVKMAIEQWNKWVLLHEF